MNGLSQANALPRTSHVRLPYRSPSEDSGKLIAMRAASSGLTMVAP